LDTETLTPRVLGDYGATETHTLEAGESGAGPHYHPITQTAHNHSTDPDLGTEDYEWLLRKRDDGGNTFAGGDTSIGQVDLATSGGIAARTANIKASAILTTAEETEADAITRTSTVIDTSTDPDTSAAEVYRRNKTDLNLGVKAAAAHTQMQPFIVINYIIKY